MGRRVSLPGAAELFRSTVPGEAHVDPTPTVGVRAGAPAVAQAIGEAVRRTQLRAVPGTGPEAPASVSASASAAPDEVREECVSVRMPADLLLELERTRAVLAHDHGLPVRRSDVLTAALDLLLEDFDSRGADSLLVRALAAD